MANETAVDFIPRLGAVCPQCGTNHAFIATSKKWFEVATGVWVKVRYHACESCDARFKSLEKST